jgi:hypothetical protein
MGSQGSVIGMDSNNYGMEHGKGRRKMNSIKKFPPRLEHKLAENLLPICWWLAREENAKQVPGEYFVSSNFMQTLETSVVLWKPTWCLKQETFKLPR